MRRRVIGAIVVVACAAVVLVVFLTQPSSHQSGKPRPSVSASGTSSTSPSTCPSASPQTVVSSWVGNTYGGADGEFVQPGIQGLWVASDGTAYGEEIWNEGARELRGYRDGHVFGGNTYQHDNDIPNGGVAVTGDTNYVYAAVRFGNTADVMRYDHNLNPAPFSGGTAPLGAVLKVNPRYESLSALAVGNGKLYVADPNSYVSQTSTAPPEKSVIRIYSTANLGAGQQASFPAPRARGLAIDGDGDIWVLEQADSSHPARIVRYTPTGRPTGQIVSGVADPSAIAVDTAGGGVGRLFVTDDGPDQNIKIFSGLDGSPKLSGTFGVKGGVNAGPVPGTVGPRRFNGPNAIGVDAKGNIYVANDGLPSFAVGNYGRGVSLEAYSPSGKLLWEDYAQRYSSTGSIDPSTGMDVYTAFDHYRLNLNKPVGQQWTRVGWTLNAFKYPNDPRIRYQGPTLPVNPTVRTIDRHKFLFMEDPSFGEVDIYRFDPPSQTAIPSGAIGTRQAKASPSTGEFIWRDALGNGDPYGNNVRREYSSPNPPITPVRPSFWIDSRGDVWQSTDNEGIVEFPVQGLDHHGNPIYTFASRRTFPTPAPFTDPRRMSYNPATDTLILSGYTTSHPTPTWLQGDYKFAGTELASYSHFTQSRHPTMNWITVLPYTETPSDAAHKTITLSVAGNYAFVGYFTGADNQLNSDIHVFDLRTGAPDGVIAPGASIGSRSGNLDMENGTTAFQEPNGEYLIFNEDDGLDKTIMYEWCAP
jgi:hypothetical protein